MIPSDKAMMNYAVINKQGSAKRQRPSMRGGICTPEATQFRGRAPYRQAPSPFFLRSLCSLTGVPPAPLVSVSFNPSLLVRGPPARSRNTPHQKGKGDQTEALSSRGELSASFSFELDTASVKQHINQNAETEAFRSRMRHSRRPSMNRILW